MDKLKTGWFSELTDLLPGRSFSMEVEQVLHQEQSKYQEILVLKTKSHGVVLVLDGMIQCTEFDEYSYQEMISFLPLFSHPKPQRVLIVGGGDGGVAREVAKHPLVETIDQVEIDDRVIELSKKYLPFMAEGFNSPKVNLHVADGFKFMEEHFQYYDVIITDSSDPIGPAVSLFQKSYFELMKRALRPGGIVCSQADTFWGHLKNAASMRNHCKAVFAKAAYATSYVSTYPAGQIGFALGSLDENTDFKNPVYQLTDKQRKDMKLRYYTTDIHKAAFALPAFVVDALDEADAENNS
ncbi:spermidine synthase-like [Acyrthosiphon pisum]|uniref:Spermidine synthase n=1 Tax=Acyrthosiphon pisum TaxID=7029 RepID=C4WS37_ACYPI|nr:spermidine synthase-like [Acyrthosiphon pisum]XP_060879438.1 spermidine synthase-like [Metopolophium dirhodum]BAH70707.1 ACYPI006984 [Acyrthosiphon pisum]|eukprot:NP_001156229.1 spermidine synthase-like [Acyrthosiphon pisum]